MKNEPNLINYGPPWGTLVLAGTFMTIDSKQTCISHIHNVKCHQNVFLKTVSQYFFLFKQLELHNKKAHLTQNTITVLHGYGQYYYN